MSTCPRCRAQVKPGLKFCTTCGAPMVAPPVARPARPQPAPPPAPRPAAPSAPPRPAAPHRPAAAPAETKGSRWGQRLWNVVTMAGCSALSGAWYWYSGMAETSPDYKTCAAIVLLPLALIVFRSAIDRALAPLQPVFGLIPRWVRLGIGLAMPFLVSNYLYARGTREFPFMFQTVVISTLVSYLILRRPEVPRRAPAKGASA